MITRITKQNRAKYEQLFADANKTLGYTNSPELQITSLEDYFSRIELLIDDSPKFVRLPLDEEFFLVDLNSRKITIPSSFKTVGLGIQGDKFAEVIYFKVDRYFETTDLNNTQIYILWENSKGQKFFDSAYLPDVTTESNYIIFGWGIGEEITETPGPIKFSVVFLDTDLIAEEDVIIDVGPLNYRLGTLPTTINVNAGLQFDINSGIGIIDSSLELRSRIKNSKPTGDPAPAQNPRIIAYNGYDWSEDIEYDLIDLIDDASTAEQEYGLTALAYSDDAGIITYTWHKGNRDSAVKLAGSYSYLLVSGSRQVDRTYYTKEGQAEYRVITESDDWDDLILNKNVFERVGFCEVTEPGKYFVTITNTSGRAVASVTPVGNVIIPAPSEIASVTLKTRDNDEIYSEGEEMVLQADVVLENPNEKDVLHYLWSDGSTSPELNITAAGEYFVTVYNSRNGGTSSTVKSNILRIYEAAIVPTGVSISANNYLNNDPEYAVLSADLKLTVIYNEIKQEGSEIKVQWQKRDTTGEWANLEGMVDVDYIPATTGSYRAVVSNYISSGNFESVESNIITVMSY